MSNAAVAQVLRHAVLEMLAADSEGLAHRSATFQTEVVRTLSFRPHVRGGLRLGDAPRAVQRATMQVLELVMSPRAFVQVQVIMALEHEVTRSSRWRKDQQPGDYYVEVHGDPRTREPWCWRLEGHHISVTATVCGDAVVVSPVFLGSNPDLLEEDGHPILQVLGPESVLAIAAIESMEEHERSGSFAGPTAPPEVRFGSSATVEIGPALSGVPVAKLGERPRKLLNKVAESYLRRAHPDVTGTLRPALCFSELRFQWSGSTAAGAELNYLLHSAGFVAELGRNLHGRAVANHVHTVVRLPCLELGGLVAP